MSASPTVVVRKGGFLTALVSGIFGTLIVCILCAGALGWYTLDLADRKVSEILGVGHNILEMIPEWTESFPVAADLLNDHRDPTYASQIEATVRLVSRESDHNDQRLVVEVTNQGSKLVTLLTARIVFLDEEGIPLHESRTFIATPLCLDEGEWRGPLQPGSNRQYAKPIWHRDEARSVSIEITDLRVWSAPAPAADADVAASLPAP
ncbi:MAG: hypothetical protein ABIG44_07770 [Planctomycetota bacterium]